MMSGGELTLTLLILQWLQPIYINLQQKALYLNLNTSIAGNFMKLVP